MSKTKSVGISAQVTPNPNTLKFVVDQLITDSGTYNFTDSDQAVGSALPEMLFYVKGVTGVMVGPNFVSVTKKDDVDWSRLAEPVTQAIQDAFASGEPLLDDALKTEHQGGSDSEAERKIKEILDNEIRPAVAMDGGDITFHSYEDGILTLHLQGACSSCPSSVMTLRMGIENRLREEIPELREVVQV